MSRDARDLLVDRFRASETDRRAGPLFVLPRRSITYVALNWCSSSASPGIFDAVLIIRIGGFAIVRHGAIVAPRIHNAFQLAVDHSKMTSLAIKRTRVTGLRATRTTRPIASRRIVLPEAGDGFVVSRKRSTPLVYSSRGSPVVHQ